LNKPLDNCPDVNFVTSSLIVTDLYDTKTCYGFNFNNTDNINYCSYYPSGSLKSAFFSISKNVSSD